MQPTEHPHPLPRSRALCDLAVRRSCVAHPRGTAKATSLAAPESTPAQCLPTSNTASALVGNAPVDRSLSARMSANRPMPGLWPTTNALDVVAESAYEVEQVVDACSVGGVRDRLTRPDRELRGHEFEGLDRAARTGDERDLGSQVALAQPAPGGRRVAAASLGQRALAVGHSVGPRGLGVTEQDQGLRHSGSVTGLEVQSSPLTMPISRSSTSPLSRRPSCSYALVSHSRRPPTAAAVWRDNAASTYMSPV